MKNVWKVWKYRYIAVKKTPNEEGKRCIKIQ